MRCLSCNLEFGLNGGRGGQNRKFCTQCLPDNLNKKERNSLRSVLLVEKSRKFKVNMGCKICGYNRCGSALEWHHNETDKEFHPAEALQRSWDRYLSETEKCVLLCANCHREVHADLISI